MTLVPVVCPHCKETYRFRQENIGSTGQCLNCKKDFMAVASPEMHRKDKAPLIIKVISTWTLLGSALSVLIAFALLAGGGAREATKIDWAFLCILIFGGGTGIVLSSCLRAGHKWAWYWFQVFVAIQAAASLLGSPGAAVISIFVGAIILIAFQMQPVKQFFRL